MSEERRPGDWQHKAQRKDANVIIKEPNAKPWYRQTFWIIFFLLVFWPVGIVLAWRSDWHIAAKIIASIFIVISVYCSLMMSQMVAQMQL
ncbi:DUF2427 domain-containing protein [Eggerthellaceae bacterium 3-80]|nr:DUF2427 domain-containing protein [bacterium D16-34]